MKAEVAEDLARNPFGSKKTKKVAEALSLQLSELRTIAEIYNPGCFESTIRKNHLIPGLAFDIVLGHDLREETARELVRDYIKAVKPGLVILSPPCHMYSQLQSLSKDRREKDPVLMARFLVRKKEADKLLGFAIEIAELCRKLGLSFVLEHPWAARSWRTKQVEKLLNNEDVFLRRTDQCYYGLRGETGQLQETDRVRKQ